MTSKFDKVLSETLNLPTEAKEQIQEAWNKQLSEARDQVAAELREEFSQKFEYDKGVMVEGVNNFLNDKITAEFEDFAQDKKAVVAERIKYKTDIGKHIDVLNQFVTEQVAKEVNSLREDRRKTASSVKKLEGFLLQQLSEEIQEFHNDKQELVRQKVKMVKEGKQSLIETKRKFVTEAAKAVESNIDKVLRQEISQYRDDIVAARQNDFGRRIFETFAGEYMHSHLNEGTQVRKMQSVLKTKEVEIASLKEHASQKEALSESVKAELNVARDLMERNEVMAGLLGPLGKEKKDIMSELLESVKTDKLRSSFEKYLPAVLNETTDPKRKPSAVLREGVVVEKTGNRAQSVAQDNSPASEIDDIIRLAGITKKQ